MLFSSLFHSLCRPWSSKRNSKSKTRSGPFSDHPTWNYSVRTRDAVLAARLDQWERKAAVSQKVLVDLRQVNERSTDLS